MKNGLHGHSTREHVLEGSEYPCVEMLIRVVGMLHCAVVLHLQEIEVASSGSAHNNALVFGQVLERNSYAIVITCKCSKINMQCPFRVCTLSKVSGKMLGCIL